MHTLRNPYIEVVNATKIYPLDRGEIEAVSHINLSVSRKEFVAIVGHSGCGKSTLLHLINGLIRPTRGIIRIDGAEIQAPHKNCGFVFQEFSLFPWRTVLENVTFGLEIQGMVKNEREIIAEKYLDLVQLSHIKKAYPAELSGGMKQRVAIARALAYEPPILLMDEPFGSLDAQTREKMQEELLKIWSDTGKTIIFVTHSIREAVFLANRVYLMKAPSNTFHKIYDVAIPYPRDLSTKTSRVMNDLVFEITTEIHRND